MHHFKLVQYLKLQCTFSTDFLYCLPNYLGDSLIVTSFLNILILGCIVSIYLKTGENTHTQKQASPPQKDPTILERIFW